MGRIFENKNVNDKILYLLGKLSDKKTESKEYANVMYELGKEFGRLILVKVKNSYKTVALASTVEDADYLGKGIIDMLEENGKEVLLTVFWNKRFNPNNENQLAVAPIIKEFREKRDIDAPVLIVIKSIISSSCVVRTNLTRLIEESSPEQILVVAPVLLKGAIKSLENEFDTSISKKKAFLDFAGSAVRSIAMLNANMRVERVAEVVA